MRSSVIGSRHVPSTTRRCRGIIGAKSRHLGVAVITSTRSAATRKERHVRDGTLGCTRACSVWVDLILLSSCVARVITIWTETWDTDFSEPQRRLLLLVKLAEEWFSFLPAGVMESIRADVGLSCASRA